MTDHISEERLIAYLLHTVSASTHQKIALELKLCPTCQQRLQNLQIEYRTIEQGVLSHLAHKRPTSQATFALLVPKLHTNKWWGGVPMKKLVYASIIAIFLMIAFTRINYDPLGFLLRQDDFEPSLANNELEATSATTEVVPVVTRVRYLPNPIKNGSFEVSQNGRLSGWTRTGSPAHEYQANADNMIYIEGTTSGFLTSNDAQSSIFGAFGLLRQRFPADGYQGKRVRLSAQLRTEEVTGQAGLWALQNAPDFENIDWMQEELLTGSTDWREYELIWDVPQDATAIEVGVVLFGAGNVWLDDVRFELVDKTTPIAGHENKLWWSSDFVLAYLLETEFSNLDFENNFVRKDTGWTVDAPRYYGIKHDKAEFATGLASARMESTQADVTNEDGSLYQAIKADTYRGQRLRLTAQIKTEAVENWASLVMRVQDANNKTLSFDAMQDRPIMGNTDWSQYEIVLDVPENSTIITVGLLLDGAGTVWLDDVQIEVVGNDVPVTSILNVYDSGEHNSDRN